MKFDKEFKEAIKNLPSSEKDKLLLRLLKKDLTLAKRLFFELVSGDTVESRRNNIEKYLRKEIEKATNSYYSPGYLMMDMRDISGKITEHVSTTKDKFGEAYLNLLLVNETLRLNHENIETARKGKAYKLCIYIIAKVFKVLILINSLHEDYRLEFNEMLIVTGRYISHSDTLMKISINNGFDVNWLLQAEIPDNIKDIHKEIRALGLLR